jgi:hypothetical protein
MGSRPTRFVPNLLIRKEFCVFWSGKW